jgi:hypothetical protein
MMPHPNSDIARDTSDFYRGYRDGKNGYAPRSGREAYLRGHHFGQARAGNGSKRRNYVN